MKTFRSQLLLKLTKYLTGHICRMDIVAWARDQYSGNEVAKWYSDQPADRQARPLLLEVLNTLCLLPREDCHEYALVRANLHLYKDQLECQGGHSPIP